MRIRPCPQCGRAPVRYVDCDTYGCPACDIWTETPHCGGRECMHFAATPERPSLYRGPIEDGAAQRARPLPAASFPDPLDAIVDRLIGAFNAEAPITRMYMSRDEIMAVCEILDRRCPPKNIPRSLDPADGYDRSPSAVEKAESAMSSAHGRHGFVLNLLGADVFLDADSADRQ